MTQTQQLATFLLTGKRISDYQGFAIMGFPNIRSRISDAQSDYDIYIPRERKKGKRYLEYFIPVGSPTSRKLRRKLNLK